MKKNTIVSIEQDVVKDIKANRKKRIKGSLFVNSDGHVDFDAFFEHLKSYGYHGDYTVEATAFDRSGTVDTEMLNECFANLRGRIG